MPRMGCVLRVAISVTAMTSLRIENICLQASLELNETVDAYQDRIDVYNLYHLLNHANLFGGSYKQQCLTAISAMRSMLL